MTISNTKKRFLKDEVITGENKSLKLARMMLKEKRVQRHKEKMGKARVKVDESMDDFMDLVKKQKLVSDRPRSSSVIPPEKVFEFHRKQCENVKQ